MCWFVMLRPVCDRAASETIHNALIDRTVNGSNEQESPASESEPSTAYSEDLQATDKPGDNDSKLPGRMEGSIESLIQNADASSKRIVTELCRQLQIPPRTTFRS